MFRITSGRQLEKKNVKSGGKRGSGFTAALLGQPSTFRAIQSLWCTSLGDNSSILVEDMTINLLTLKRWRSETLNKERDPLSCTCAHVGSAQGQPAWSRCWTIGQTTAADSMDRPLAGLGKLQTTALEVFSVLLMGPMWGVGSAASQFYMLMGKMC